MGSKGVCEIFQCSTVATAADAHNVFSEPQKCVGGLPAVWPPQSYHHQSRLCTPSHHSLLSLCTHMGHS